MAKTGDLFYKYISSLRPDLDLPEGVSVINPFIHKEAKTVFRKFCDSCYQDAKPRTLILGINPGRFGAGITGIPFTDPVSLETDCGIPNGFEKKRELSSRFVYEFIRAFGGVKKFYGSFLLSAVCPVGFLKGSVNYNYYDSPDLLKSSESLIIDSIKRHSGFNINTANVVSFGKKNSSFLNTFNKKLELFDKIITLEHPRYIMQYKLKTKDRYLSQYADALGPLL